MQQGTNLTVTEPRDIVREMAERYGMEAGVFEHTVVAICWPKKEDRPTVSEFLAFLSVCREYKLNPLTKEIYGFRSKSGAIVPIVSVDGWVNLMNSHPAMDGLEFDDHIEGTGIVAITARIWRNDRQRPIVVTEYMEECKRNSDPWKQYPRRMLRHKAMIQCARYAFGFSGFYDPDEAERINGNGDVSPMRVIEDDGPPPPPAPSPPPSPSPTREEGQTEVEIIEAGRREPVEILWEDDAVPIPIGRSSGNDDVSAKLKSQWLSDLHRNKTLADCAAWSTALAKCPGLTQADRAEIEAAFVRHRQQFLNKQDLPVTAA